MYVYTRQRSIAKVKHGLMVVSCDVGVMMLVKAYMSVVTGNLHGIILILSYVSVITAKTS